MEHIDDYDLFDKDFEKFVQIGRETFGLEQERTSATETGSGTNFQFIRIFTPREIRGCGSHLSEN